MQTSFTRQQLYDLVWTHPIKSVAERYGVSDVAFAKMCKRNEIPIPFRGYWAKIQAGKKAPNTPLPLRALGMPEIIELGGHSDPYYRGVPKDLISIDLPPPPKFPESADQLSDRIRKLVGKVAIPKNFDRAHYAIAKRLGEDQARRLKQQSDRYSFSWDAPHFESPFERRRLRLINALMVALIALDKKVTMRGKNPSGFEVTIGQQHLSVLIDHPKQERSAYTYPSESNRPASDPLRARISSSYRISNVQLVWDDVADSKIEKSIDDIVVNILLAGELQYRQREIHHHEWLVKRKAQLIEEARKQKEEEERLAKERKIKAEQARIDRLLGEAAAFRKAVDIRNYIESVRAVNSNSNDPLPNEEIDAWSSWALAQANRIDPVASKKFLTRDIDDADG